MHAGCEPRAHLRRSAASAEALGGAAEVLALHLWPEVPKLCQSRATLCQRWSSTEPPAWVPRGQILPRSGAMKESKIIIGSSQAGLPASCALFKAS